MPGIERQGDPASCGHTNTGSTTVFVNGKGVTRVVQDTAGSVIIGPGSQTVYAEGFKVSLPGDAIAGHGKPPHSAPFTTSPSTNVFAGTGFIGTPGGTQPRPDLVTIFFQASIAEANTSGQPEYPPLNWQAAISNCSLAGGSPVSVFNTPPPGFVEFTFGVQNQGQETSQPFEVGLWLLPTGAQGGGGLLGAQGVNLVVPATQITYEDPEIQAFYNNVSLIDSIHYDGLVPGASVTGQFIFPQYMYLNQQSYNFAIYADINLTATEPQENNSTQVITIPINDSC